MNRHLAFLLFLFSCTHASPQTEIPSIAGWNRQVSNGITRFTPKNHNGSGVFYEILPLQKITKEEEKNYAAWLKQAVMKNLQSSGYTTTSVRDEESLVDNGYYFYTMAITPSSGKTVVVSFFSYQRQDRQIRLAKYVQPGDVKTALADTAFLHFITLSKKEGKMKDYNATSQNKNSVQDKNVGLQNSAKQNSASASLLRPADIEGIVIHEEYGYGAGGLLMLEYKPYLLLKDGSILKYPKSSPYEINTKTSRQSEPDKWGTWKLHGKTLMVQLPERGVIKTYEWKEKQWYRTRPGSKGEIINGSYLAMSGGGNTALGGSTMIATSSNIRFNSKGQFTHSTSTGVTTSETGIYSEADKAGTYKVDGYSIELLYNNGQTARLLFYFFPDGKDNFGLGGRTYTKE